MSLKKNESANLYSKKKDQEYLGTRQNMGKDGSSYAQSLIDDDDDEEDDEDAIALELDDDTDDEDGSSEDAEDMTVEFEDDDFIDEDFEEGENMVIEATEEEDWANSLLDDEDDEDL
jgi:hypothetical protein